MKITRWWIPLLLLLLGLLAFGRVILTYRTHHQALQARQNTLRALESLASTSASGMQMRAAFEALQDPPASHEVLAQTYLPGRAVTIRRLGPIEIDNAWQRERVEVTVAAAPWDEIAIWMAKVSNERPPWRLTSFSMEAIGENLGAGKFTFTVPERK